MLFEVSCIQYDPKDKTSKDEAERIAILQVCRDLRRRGFEAGIFQFRLGHRNSGHVHVFVSADENAYRLICGCCKEAQKRVRNPRGIRRDKVCNCKDCIACEPSIRHDLEQLTRY